MKCAFFPSALLLISACDPRVAGEYVVSATAGDDSTSAESAQIAQALAQRHGMQARSLDSSCELASYEADVSGPDPGPRFLDFCVDPRGPWSVSFSLVEIIASDWSSKGDSLRHELEDTLQARFGNRVKRNP